MPDGNLKVETAEMRKNSSGVEFPVLQLTDEDGNKYDCSAWARDVRACINEYGKEPTSWGAVRVALNTSKTRYELVPAKENLTMVEVPNGTTKRVRQ